MLSSEDWLPLVVVALDHLRDDSPKFYLSWLEVASPNDHLTDHQIDLAMLLDTFS